MKSTWHPPDLRGKVAIVTGSGGSLAGAIAMALAGCGTEVVVCDLREDAAERTAAEIRDRGGRCVVIAGDVCDSVTSERALASALGSFGRCDILINGVGGGWVDATTSSNLEFFSITQEAMSKAHALNFTSVMVPCQVIGQHFSTQQTGSILNIASIAGVRPLTRVVGYNASKGAVINFTQWLAVHFAQEYDPSIRVNALAPGFVVTEQNRFLLVDEEADEFTARAHKILGQVPMGRFGNPDEITGGALWLVSDAALFVTGAVVPIDGGLLAASGV